MYDLVRCNPVEFLEHVGTNVFIHEQEFGQDAVLDSLHSIETLQAEMEN